MFRFTVVALRTAKEPLTVRETTDAVMAARKIAGATTKQQAGLEAAIQSCLESNAGKTGQRVGESVLKRWALTANLTNP
jgi:hypothetical protein